MRQLISIVCLLLAIVGNSQNKQKTNPKEFCFSASTGVSFFGANLNDYMRINGFDDPAPDFFGGPPILHPYSRKKAVFDIRLGYYRNSKIGFAVNYGLINNIEGNGYKSLDSLLFGAYSILESKLHVVSAAICYQLTNKTDITAGPSIVLHNVVETNRSSSNTKDVKLGLQIGAYQKLYSSRELFFALDVHYCWSPKSEIGPFGGDRVFPLLSSKIDIATFYIGLSFGLQLHHR